MEYETNGIGFRKTCVIAVLIVGALAATSAAIAKFFPTEKIIPFTPDAELVETQSEEAERVDTDVQIVDVAYFYQAVQNGDDGLALYRDPRTRALVESFYLDETKQDDVAMAILEQADRYDIPLSLAFALAYTESRYNANAVNRNSNGTVDRGLFQLNSNSFPNLSEADFFDAETSARYGLSHLQFCLDSAGSAVAALAMYNAGMTKVRSNGTPQRTLNYIDSIITYKQMLDRRFASEAISFPDTMRNAVVLAEKF